MKPTEAQAIASYDHDHEANLAYEYDRRIDEKRLLAEYREAASEARACGYEFPSFDEWTGRTKLKDEKMSEWQDRFDNDTQDLY